MYRLAIDGDDLEKYCWNKFIQTEFSSYERFWQTFITPLTNRPRDIHFKNDLELTIINKGHQDICIAQLHYSVLRNLFRAFININKDLPLGLDELTYGITQLCSALDVADEMLERFSNSNKYSAWQENDGKNARHTWRKLNGELLRPLRYYRNHLIHGRLSPSIDGLFPVIGKEQYYLDWRVITDKEMIKKLDQKDFLSPQQILNGAWKDILKYFETMWQKHLLK